MTESCKAITTEKQMRLEIQLIINRRLYEGNIIDRVTYETVMSEILKEIQKTKQHKGAD